MKVCVAVTYLGERRTLKEFTAPLTALETNSFARGLTCLQKHLWKLLSSGILRREVWRMGTGVENKKLSFAEVPANMFLASTSTCV